MVKKPYKILGVDPGTNILGYAIVEINGSSIELVTIGDMRLSSYPDHTSKLKEIYLQLQEIIETYRPSEMAIEAPFYGKNVQSMLKLGRAQGVAMAAAITMGLTISEYSPKKIKQSITGNGNASKEQVSSMLDVILESKVVHSSLDASDALATAICHFHQMSSKISQPRSNGWKGFIKNNPSRVR